MRCFYRRKASFEKSAPKKVHYSWNSHVWSVWIRTFYLNAVNQLAGPSSDGVPFLTAFQHSVL